MLNAYIYDGLRSPFGRHALRLSSPAWLVSPKITSSISAPGTPVFFSSF
jgi:hypothetical protein